MVQFRNDDDKGNGATNESIVATQVAEEPNTKVASDEGENITRAVALAIVAVGVALVEVELLAGVALGAAAMVAPRIISAFMSGKKKAAKSLEQAEADKEGAATV